MAEDEHGQGNTRHYKSTFYRVHGPENTGREKAQVDTFLKKMELILNNLDDQSRDPSSDIGLPFASTKRKSVKSSLRFCIALF